MNPTAFIIIIGCISVGMIYTLISVLHFEPVAKAGKVNKLCWKYHSVSPQPIIEIETDGQRVDVSSLKRLYVCGDSMHKYGIRSHQQVFAQVLNPKERLTITSYPVLVLNIINRPPWDSDYKLRKFVGYVSNLESSEEYWSEIYVKYASRIKIDKNTFIADCMKKTDKISDTQRLGEFVLSETYDENKQREAYSIHNVDTIYGQVKYAV